MTSTLHNDARRGQLTTEKLSKYLQDGVGIDEIDSTGFTPLILAAKFGHVSVVKLLLDKGASPSLKSTHGVTPLHEAVKAKNNRADIVRLIIDRNVNVDETSDDCHNDTPLMVAIAQVQDATVVKMLINAGASLQAKNDRGQTAEMLARTSSLAIQKAVSPLGQQNAWVTELINTIVNFVLFILAYVDSGLIKGVTQGVVSNLYHIGNVQPDRNIANEIDNPVTVDDFKDGVEDYVRKQGLGQFFDSNKQFLEKVAEKAVELKNDPTNHLKEPEQIKGLVRLALYQPVFYCDDSGSMENIVTGIDGNPIDTRMNVMKMLVKRMASIATRVVPEGKGAHLRFINRNDNGEDLNQEQIDEKMNINPDGSTRIGERLEKKILKPMVYEKLERDGKLDRPYLILTVTDGEPQGEPQETFKNAILNCSKRLEEYQYPQESVMFLMSQIGNDEAADRFLDSLRGDAAIDRVLFCTSERLHEKYIELVENESKLEEWLLKLLLSPITG